MRNILLIDGSDLQLIYPLLDQVTKEGAGCGVKKDTCYVVQIDRQPFFTNDGTEAVDTYNQMVHTSIQNGYTDILVTYKTIEDGKEESKDTTGT